MIKILCGLLLIVLFIGCERIVSITKEQEIELCIATYELGYAYGKNNLPEEKGRQKIRQIINDNWER